MRNIVFIVEGEGEQLAIPKLFYKIIKHLNLKEADFKLSTPYRVNWGKLVNVNSNEKIKKDIEKTLKKADLEGGIIIILVDLDDDKESELNNKIKENLPKLKSNLHIAFAIREYEEWYLASLNHFHQANSINYKQLPDNLPKPETKRGVKEWVEFNILNCRYNPNIQLELTKLIDIDSALQHGKSFNNFYQLIQKICM